MSASLRLGLDLYVDSNTVVYTLGVMTAESESSAELAAGALGEWPARRRPRRTVVWLYDLSGEQVGAIT